MKKKFREQLTGMGFVLPAITLFTVFVLYPVVNIFIYSFMEWDGMGEMTFIGLENFEKIFSSPEFWTALKNNFKFLIIGVPIWTIFPMIVAVLLNEEVKGWKFFKSAFFFPTVVSGAVMATLFKTFFMYSGPVNKILALFGLEGIEWFAKGDIAIGLIIFFINWSGFGSAVLIFLAGMSNFSKEIFEAADLEGAGWWQKFLYMSIPLLKPTLKYVIMLNVMAAFSGMFSTIFLMTGGGPGYETTVIEYLLYTKAFKLHDMGYASALSVVLFAIVSMITILQFVITKKNESY